MGIKIHPYTEELTSGVATVIVNPVADSSHPSAESIGNVGTKDTPDLGEESLTESKGDPIRKAKQAEENLHHDACAMISPA